MIRYNRQLNFLEDVGHRSSLGAARIFLLYNVMSLFGNVMTVNSDIQLSFWISDMHNSMVVKIPPESRPKSIEMSTVMMMQIDSNGCKFDACDVLPQPMTVQISPDSTSCKQNHVTEIHLDFLGFTEVPLLWPDQFGQSWLAESGISNEPDSLVKWQT